MLTQARLKELLHYDSVTGVFTWRVKVNSRVSVGGVAGFLRSDGYWQIKIANLPYLAHRLAWLWYYGVWPNAEIDHIDGNPSNNGLINLREATHFENMQNVRGARRNNKSSGELGVSWHRPTCKWRVRITVNRHRYHIGLYSTIEAAKEAYLAEKRLLHPFHPSYKEMQNG